MKTGIVLNEPIDAYHASPCISHSKIRYFSENYPVNYRRKFITKELAAEPEKDCYIIGNAVEFAVSFGMERALNEYSIAPMHYLAPASTKKEAPLISKPWNWNATFCKDWRDQQARPIITSTESFLILRMYDAVMANPDARALIEASTPQVTFRTLGGHRNPAGEPISAQCRSDFWSHNGTTFPSDGTPTGAFDCDLKTIDSLSPSAFKSFDKHALELGYDLAQVFYQFVIHRVLAETAGIPAAEVIPPNRYFIVVSKEEFPQCVVYQMPPELLSDAQYRLLGDDEAPGLLPRLIDHYVKDEWPGAPIRKTVEIPSWKRRSNGLMLT